MAVVRGPILWCVLPILRFSNLTAYFVSRHPGAVDWARRRGIVAEALKHLDIGCVRPGDCVLGTLPVSVAAAVCARGARYFHLSVNVPPEARGRELSADEMDVFGAELEEYDIRRTEAGKP